MKNLAKDVGLILIAVLIWSVAIDLAGGRSTGMWTWRSVGIWSLMFAGAKVYGAANYWHPYRRQS